MTSLLTAGVTIYATTSGSSDRNREMDIKMLELSLQILREDPKTSQINATRDWAVNLINYVSPVKIPDDARKQLINYKLPILFVPGYQIKGFEKLVEGLNIVPPEELKELREKVAKEKAAKQSDEKAKQQGK